MGWKRCAALAAVFVLMPVAATADPIEDMTIKPYKAAWFPNVYKGEALTCVDTCKRNRAGLAEYEASAVPSTKRAFVCRIQGAPKGNLRTWQYGSQFDERPACYTTGLDLKGSYEKNYLCLCVTAAR